MFNPLIDAVYNLHKGESCIIICNGPSLKKVSRKLLAENITFGTNKIFMFPFIPNYYVSVNPLVIKQCWRQILDMNAMRFVSESTPAPFEQDSSLMKLHSMSAPVFSYDPSRYIYEGHTVTFVCLQLAFFMGFTKVGLVGCDHRYEFDGQPNEELVMEGDDPNHFHPDYFKGQKWNAPDLGRSEDAYTMANEAFEDDGRKIFNLTPGSALEVFRKMNLKEWIQ